MIKHFALAGLLLLTSACLQTENSSSQDDGLSGDGTLFGNAQAILTQKCANCHIYHSKTEQELIDDGDIQAGNAEASVLYYRLQGSSGSGGAKDMPQSDSISSADVAAIADWINGISN